MSLIEETFLKCVSKIPLLRTAAVVVVAAVTISAGCKFVIVVTK